jgi:hypothetical protein
MIMRSSSKQTPAGNKNKDAGFVGQLKSLVVHHVQKWTSQ